MKINDTFPNDKIMGVYKIENIKNNKIYIGSSKDIYTRWKQHIYELKKNIHHSFKLQNDYNQANSKDIFDFDIIVIVKEIKLLKPIEELCICKYNSYYNGYNCCSEADNPKYSKISKIKATDKFIWMYQNITNTNFDNISLSDMTRLLYLSTYLGYNEYLQYNNHPMKKNDIKNKLKLSIHKFSDFYSTMIKYNMLQEINNKIYLDKTIFNRGKINQTEMLSAFNNNKTITRLYVNTMHYLYSHSTARNQKTIAYVFELIPFINKKYNICCENIDETDFNLIIPFDEKQICKKVGYNPHNYKQLFDMLKSIQLNNQQESIIYQLKCSLYPKINTITIINPNLLYGGEEKDECLKFIHNLLDEQ